LLNVILCAVRVALSDQARHSQIDPKEELHFQIEKGDKEDQFDKVAAGQIDKVAAGQKAANLTAHGIAKSKREYETRCTFEYCCSTEKRNSQTSFRDL
jgi:hypothetical protein